MTKPSWSLKDIAPPKAATATPVATLATPSSEPIATPKVTEPDKPKRAGRPRGIVETTKRSRPPKFGAPPPPEAPYTPPDDTYAPTQEHGGQHIAAAMAALEAGVALEDERKKLEALILSKQARIEALQAEIRAIEAQCGKPTT